MTNYIIFEKGRGHITEVTGVLPSVGDEIYATFDRLDDAKMVVTGVKHYIDQVKNNDFIEHKPSGIHVYVDVIKSK